VVIVTLQSFEAKIDQVFVGVLANISITHSFAVEMKIIFLMLNRTVMSEQIGVLYRMTLSQRRSVIRVL
jgi:hypothetical protein